MKDLNPIKPAVQPNKPSDKTQALTCLSGVANSAEYIIFSGLGIESLHGNIGSNVAFAQSDRYAPEFAEQNFAANNGETKGKANFARFWAKLANFAPKGSRRDNAQKSAANRNTGEKDNA